MLALEIRVTEPDGARRVATFGFSPVLVGRSPLCQMRLQQPWVSNAEGSITFDASSITYLNVGSGDKCRVNGEPLGFHNGATLDEASELRIGDVRLQFKLRDVRADDPGVIAKRPEPGPEVASGAGPTSAWQAGGSDPVVPCESGPTGARLDSGAKRPRARKPSDQPAQRTDRQGPQNAPDVVSDEPVTTPIDRRAHTKGAPAPNATLRELHAAYRESWALLMAELKRELDALPADTRATRARALQREYRQLAYEPEFRAYLEARGLSPNKPGIPELEAWLQTIGHQVLPAGMKLESGFSLRRLLDVVEALAAGVSMITADQERIRERVFKLPPRESLLHEDDTNVVLAYLLNPSAEWSARKQELVAAMQQLFNHQTALLQAISAGAHELLDSLSPETVRQQVTRDKRPERDGRAPGLLRRLTGSDAPEVALWRRYVRLHETLISGRHYEKALYGKGFQQKYNRALGRLKDR